MHEHEWVHLATYGGQRLSSYCAVCAASCTHTWQMLIPFKGQAPEPAFCITCDVERYVTV